MKQIVAFKQTGEYPVQGLSPKQKNHFRVSARRYTLSENGDLMCLVKGQFFPGEDLTCITGATGALVEIFWIETLCPLQNVINVWSKRNSVVILLDVLESV